jgi:hypothetical protein
MACLIECIWSGIPRKDIRVSNGFKHASQSFEAGLKGERGSHVTVREFIHTYKTPPLISSEFKRGHQNLQVNKKKSPVVLESQQGADLNKRICPCCGAREGGWVGNSRTKCPTVMPNCHKRMGPFLRENASAAGEVCCSCVSWLLSALPMQLVHQQLTLS